MSLWVVAAIFRLDICIKVGTVRLSRPWLSMNFNGSLNFNSYVKYIYSMTEQGHWFYSLHILSCLYHGKQSHIKVVLRYENKKPLIEQICIPPQEAPLKCSASLMAEFVVMKVSIVVAVWGRCQPSATKILSSNQNGVKFFKCRPTINWIDRHMHPHQK